MKTDGIHITINQTRCEKFTIDWLIDSYQDRSRTAHVLTLDGKFNQDFGWFGERRRLRTSAQFRSGVLEIVAGVDAVWDATVLAWKQTFEMLLDKDLCTRFFDTGIASWSASRAERQNSNTPLEKTKPPSGPEKDARR